MARPGYVPEKTGLRKGSIAGKWVISEKTAALLRQHEAGTVEQELNKAKPGFAAAAGQEASKQR